MSEEIMDAELIETEAEDNGILEVERFELDFDMLEQWRNPDFDDLPICGFISLYRAIGVLDRIREYNDTHDKDKQFVPLDNLACNFYTLQRMRNLILDNWSCYSLDIDSDRHVFWDTTRWAKNQKHYKKKLHAKVRNSINIDCANFCPGVDDELEDNILIFRVPKSKKKVDTEPIIVDAEINSEE